MVLDPEKRGRLEPGRMTSTAQALRDIGCQVDVGPDPGISYRVSFPNGKRFVFYPYSGWFQGRERGRGFKNLVEAGQR